jgi:hypothetical protein
MSKIILTFLSVIFLFGCGQSAYDKCIDSKDYLWNPEIENNQYEGNEAYWNAVKDCE